eukprot:8680397-Lingulodinium_polyedra.AAC.1
MLEGERGTRQAEASLDAAADCCYNLKKQVTATNLETHRVDLGMPREWFSDGEAFKVFVRLFLENNYDGRGNRI